MVDLAGHYFAKVSWFKKRSMTNSSSVGNIESQFCQRCKASSGIGSSQPNLLRHRSCNRVIARKMEGATNPKARRSSKLWIVYPFSSLVFL
jgi:hypothetical protein